MARSEDTVPVALPRGAITLVQPSPPLWVTPYNCLEVLGLPPEAFARFCREGWLPGARRRGHTWLVPYDAARRALDDGPARPDPGPAADEGLASGPPPDEDPDERTRRAMAAAGIRVEGACRGSGRATRASSGAGGARSSGPRRASGSGSSSTG